MRYYHKEIRWHFFYQSEYRKSLCGSKIFSLEGKLLICSWLQNETFEWWWMLLIFWNRCLEFICFYLLWTLQIFWFCVACCSQPSSYPHLDQRPTSLWDCSHDRLFSTFPQDQDHPHHPQRSWSAKWSGRYQPASTWCYWITFELLSEFFICTMTLTDEKTRENCLNIDALRPHHVMIHIESRSDMHFE